MAQDIRSGTVQDPEATADGDELYLITLKSSLAPVPLEQITAPELAGLAVFRSKRREDGRDRFRLHIGYFDSAAAANAVLPILRRTHPEAWVGPAPKGGMGSLDDTALSRFRIVAPAEDADDEPARSVAPEVACVPTPPPAAEPRLADAAAVQQYAVQLMWSLDPIDRRRVAHRGLIDGYLLYRVESVGGPRRWYGLRLGFFSDANAARFIAQYVRKDFRHATVVPVSEREHARAQDAAVKPTEPALTRPTPET